MPHYMSAIIGFVFLAAASVAGAPHALAQSEDPVTLEKNCSKKDAFACANLAVLLRHGRGTNKSYARALTLFVMACEKGNDFACGAVGDMTYRGLGIPSDPQRGEQLLRGACRRGNEWSCESLRRLLDRRRRS